MNYSIMKALVFVLMVCVSPIACGQLSGEAKELMDAAYSGAREFDAGFFDRVRMAPFDSEIQRKFALMQAYAATEKPDLVVEAIAIAKEIVSTEVDGCDRDLARINLAMLLALNGQHKDGAELAVNALGATNYKRLKESKEPLIVYLSTRLGIKAVGWEPYLKSNLRRSIGSYYLNRPAVDGGPDLQKAVNYFSLIPLFELRQACLADVRLKGMYPSGKGSLEDIQQESESQSTPTPRDGDSTLVVPQHPNSVQNGNADIARDFDDRKVSLRFPIMLGMVTLLFLAAIIWFVWNRK
jgi:hypothetical protein